VAACACLAVTGPEWPGASAPLPRPPRPQPDAQRLPGTWHVLKAYANGKHLQYEVSEGQVWVITRDRITLHYEDSPAEEFSYRLDPMGTPKSIDLIGLNDARRVAFRGVYELKGDRLKVCRSRLSRPAALEVGELERGEVLFVLERRK
jgi:uncharacterized protein (TIGR03067 family)